jgi:hypothetical protein
MTLRGDFGSLRGAKRRGNPFSRPYDPPGGRGTGDGRRADEGIGPYGHTDLDVGPDAPIGPRPRRNVTRKFIISGLHMGFRLWYNNVSQKS